MEHVALLLIFPKLEKEQEKYVNFLKFKMVIKLFVINIRIDLKIVEIMIADLKKLQTGEDKE